MYVFLGFFGWVVCEDDVVDVVDDCVEKGFVEYWVVVFDIGLLYGVGVVLCVVVCGGL